MASQTGIERPATLILVCCHAIFVGENPWDETHWALESFQRSNPTKPGEHLTFIKHIQAGYSLLKESQSTGEEDGVLLFSGGPTKASHPGKSEARSYLEALKTLEEFDDEPNTKTRHICLDEHATDSFQNILFGILKCYKQLGRYPSTIKVITHAFKRERMLLHKKAIKWYMEWTVFGINPPFAGMRGSQKTISLTNDNQKRKWHS
jgi:hypothetical protein